MRMQGSQQTGKNHGFMHQRIYAFMHARTPARIHVYNSVCVNVHRFIHPSVNFLVCVGFVVQDPP